MRWMHSFRSGCAKGGRKRKSGEDGVGRRERAQAAAQDLGSGGGAAAAWCCCDGGACKQSRLLEGDGRLSERFHCGSEMSRDRCSVVRISTDAAVNSGKRLAWRCTEPAAVCGIGLHDEEV